MKWLVVFFIMGLVHAHSWAKAYQTFEENGKIGMKDETGHVVFPPAFEALGWSDGNFSVVGKVTGYRLNGSWGIIDLEKNFVTSAEFESLVYGGGDCIVAQKKINAVTRKAGCIDLKGEIKIPFVYDGILLQGLRAIVFNLSGGHYYYGLTDLTHRVLIPMIYRDIRPLGTLRFAVENSENKIALFAEDGKPITGFSIDSISNFYKSLATVYQNHLQGLIDRSGAAKLETKYASIKIDEDGKVFARLPHEWSFIDGNNVSLKKIFADGVKPLSGNRLIIRKGNVCGVVDQELNTILPIEYDSLAEIEQGKYLAKRKGKTGMIDEMGKPIIPFSFDSIMFEKKLYRAFNKNSGWQLINTSGKELTGKWYQYLGPANNLGFLAMSKGFFGMINTDGNEFVHCVFDSIAQPTEGLMAVKFRGLYGIINAKEDWVVAPQEFPLRVINGQRYLLKQTDNNFIKSYSAEILYFSPYRLSFGKENFMEFLPDGSLKIIDYNGVMVYRTSLSESADKIFAESEGFRGIKKDGRYGFVDGRGRLRIANRYDSIGEFHEGLAAVKLIGKWGFVNTSDQIVINPNFDQASFFKNDQAIISRERKTGVIGKNGEVILPTRYDKILQQDDGKFLLISSGLLGLADEIGNVLIEPRFNLLQNAGKGLLITCREGKCGVITEKGLNIVPMIYDKLEVDHSQGVFLAERKSDWKEVVIK